MSTSSLPPEFSAARSEMRRERAARAATPYTIDPVEKKRLDDIASRIRAIIDTVGIIAPIAASRGLVYDVVLQKSEFADKSLLRKKLKLGSKLVKSDAVYKGWELDRANTTTSGAKGGRIIQGLTFDSAGNLYDFKSGAVPIRDLKGDIVKGRYEEYQDLISLDTSVLYNQQLPDWVRGETILTPAGDNQWRDASSVLLSKLVVFSETNHLI